MDARTVWDNLALAIAEMQKPGGDHELKLATVRAGVELLFEQPPAEILSQLGRSSLPRRALASWLVFEGGRLPGVAPAAVEALRGLYEATCPPGEGLIPPPPGGRSGLA